MRILIVTHYYPPEVGAPQARLSALAKAWIGAGDDVTVLTGFPNHPTGIVPDAYRGSLRMEERLDGVRVIRTWLYATPNERVLRKTIGHLSFMFSSLLFGARKVGKPDVVVASSPTFFSIFSGWLIARLKRARFVLEVRDLWPEAIVALGVLRNRFLIRLLQAVERASYRSADAIVVLSKGFREAILRRGVAEDKVHFIPNGVDVDRFVHGQYAGEMRRRLGARDGETLVLYAGAHGVSYALTGVAEVAAQLRDEPIRFVFVGDGAAKSQLAEHVRAAGLANVTMLPSIPHDQMPDLLQAADICLLPDRDIPFLGTMIRAKIFEYLAAGRPVVAGTQGETAQILREAGAIVVAPEDTDAMVAAIRDLAHDPQRRRALGDRGREYVRRCFSRDALAAVYRSLLGRVTGSD